MLLAVAMTTMGSTCISITDPLVITLNVKDIKDTYDITPGTVTSTIRRGASFEILTTISMLTTT